MTLLELGRAVEGAEPPYGMGEPEWQHLCERVTALGDVLLADDVDEPTRSWPRPATCAPPCAPTCSRRRGGIAHRSGALTEAAQVPMILAELEVFHSRPIAPTRRVALGRAHLPVQPAPGFGGILLGGVVAAYIPGLDPELFDDLDRLTHQLEDGHRIPQPRLRHRLQTDRVGLQRSVHRLLGEGEDLTSRSTRRAPPAQHILAAVYAAGALRSAPAAGHGRHPQGDALERRDRRHAGRPPLRSWPRTTTGRPRRSATRSWALGVLDAGRDGRQRPGERGHAAPVPRPGPRGPPRPRRRHRRGRRSGSPSSAEARRILLAGMSAAPAPAAAVPGRGHRQRPPAASWPSSAVPSPRARACRCARADFPYRRGDGGRPTGRRSWSPACATRPRPLVAERPASTPARSCSAGGRWAGACARWRWPRGCRAAGLVLVCYPLHPPGRPDKLRVEHLPGHRRALPVRVGHPRPLRHPRRARAAHTAAIAGPVTHVWLEGARHELKGADDEVAGIVAAWLKSL